MFPLDIGTMVTHMCFSLCLSVSLCIRCLSRYGLSALFLMSAMLNISAQMESYLQGKRSKIQISFCDFPTPNTQRKESKHSSLTTSHHFFYLFHSNLLEIELQLLLLETSYASLRHSTPSSGQFLFILQDNALSRKPFLIGFFPQPRLDCPSFVHPEYKMTC